MKTRGFSLIEVLVTAMILVLLITGIYMVLHVGDRTFRYDSGLLELQQQARGAMDGMVRELRQGNASSINITNLTVNSTNITFSVRNVTLNQTYSINYALDNSSRIIRENPVGSNCDTAWNDTNCKILANNIAYLRFNISGNDLSVRLRAEKTVRNKQLFFPLKDNATDATELRVLKEQVRLRNE